MAADKDLIQAVVRMKNGEEEGFNLVYNGTYSYVLFRARQIMKDEDDAMDLLQTVYIEAYRSIDSLDKPENIFAWLGAITYRQGMKIFRKKNEILLDEETSDAVFGNMVSTDKSLQPELSTEERERAEEIKKFIEELPETQRTTLVAHYYDGISIEDIADVMDCSVGTVKSRLNYARKYLKKRLQESSGLDASKVGAVAITVPVLIGAIGAMSEETVMAAPAAAASYAAICGKLGIAAGSVIAAGAAAGGAGTIASVSAGSAAATTSATAATTTAATTATAATTTAATTVTAATTTAASTATTAAAGAASTAAASAAGSAATVGGAVVGGTAAKSVAVAVAVAVAGTGVGVGTAVHNNMSNSEAPEHIDMSISGNVGLQSSNDYVISQNTVIAISEDEVTVSINKVSEDKVKDENRFSENSKDVVKEDKTEKTEDKEKTSEKKKKKKKTVSEPVAPVYEMSVSNANKIAAAAASVLPYIQKGKYSGDISNEALDEAYSYGALLHKDELTKESLSDNKAFILNAKVTEIAQDGYKLKVKGSFVYGKENDKEEWEAYNYTFTLNFKIDENSVSYEKLTAQDIKIKKKEKYTIEYVEPVEEDAKKASSVSQDVIGDDVLPVEEVIPLVPQENTEEPSGGHPEESIGTEGISENSISEAE